MSWLYGWGAGGQGQLGHKSVTDRPTPAGPRHASKSLATAEEAGARASAAKDAGSNSPPQEESTPDTVMVTVPRVVDCMRGVPFSRVACGAFHTAAVTGRSCSLGLH